MLGQYCRDILQFRIKEYVVAFHSLIIFLSKPDIGFHPELQCKLFSCSEANFSLPSSLSHNNRGYATGTESEPPPAFVSNTASSQQYSYSSIIKLPR